MKKKEKFNLKNFKEEEVFIKKNHVKTFKRFMKLVEKETIFAINKKPVRIVYLEKFEKGGRVFYTIKEDVSVKVLLEEDFLVSDIMKEFQYGNLYFVDFL
mgnify:CR=1 FL=1